LLFAAQADVQRRGPAAADVDLRHVGSIAGLANLDGVRTFRQLDDETILATGPSLVFAVD
jgi:hypothetical protein